MKIISPTLLLNEEKCRNNIRTMALKARQQQVIFRPHFKTHQSHEIGRWHREEGVETITVSSFKMAEYFAEDGWKDITVAFPVNILEIERINRLASSIQLNLLTESIETLDFLEEHLSAQVAVFIKIDAGYHRTGVDYQNYALLDQMLAKLQEAQKMKFKGFLLHSGHSYECRSVEDIEALHQESIRRLVGLKERYIGQFPGLLLSVGDTPTCSKARDFSEVDEMRPGNFVFYDYTQHRIGSCSSEEIAVAMACPVVALHPERQEVLIYGGSVHFSKDRVENLNGQTIFGQLVRSTEDGWAEPLEEVYIKKLSQEHGTLHAPLDFINKLKVGDIVKILPVHSCTNSDLMGKYVTTEGKTISRI